MTKKNDRRAARAKKTLERGQARREHHEKAARRAYEALVSSIPVPPEALTKYKWLTPLLEAFSLADEATKHDLDKRAREGLQPPACHKGCCACCLNSFVAINALELMGLSWYICEVQSGETRKAVRRQLLTHRDRTSCPFLVENGCSVYPLRPLACRHFYVQGHPCKPGEHVDKTRPDDILLGLGMQPAMDVATIMLRALGHGSIGRCRELACQGALVDIGRPMHEHPLELLVKNMDAFDSAFGPR